ncbi:MAG TPA: helix-turn-helix transcriptional regulator [Magnetospirillaceae bacterium]|jgi:DNA-binding XRE family transcriptional regulator
MTAPKRASEHAKDLAFTRAAARQLAGLLPGERQGIREALYRYVDDPASMAGRVVAMKTAPVSRLAIGTKRLVIVEDERRIVVLKVGLADTDNAFALLRDLATGREERVREETLDRLLAGENMVKVWREHRGITQTRLARLAGINAHYLSKIETGTRHPSDEVMADIQHALGIDAHDFGLLVDLPGRRKRKRR